MLRKMKVRPVTQFLIFSQKKKAQLITFLRLKIYTNSEAMFL